MRQVNVSVHNDAAMLQQLGGDGGSGDLHLFGVVEFPLEQGAKPQHRFTV